MEKLQNADSAVSGLVFSVLALFSGIFYPGAIIYCIIASLISCNIANKRFKKENVGGKKLVKIALWINLASLLIMGAYAYMFVVGQLDQAGVF